jgi:hypothetical protein
MWRLIEAVIVKRLAGSLRLVLVDSVDRLRRVGVVLVIAHSGATIALMGIFFLFLSLFFQLSGEVSYVQPAYVVGLSAFLLAFGILFIADRLSRR